MQQDIAATTAGNYDLFARPSLSTEGFTSSGNILSLRINFNLPILRPGMVGLVRDIYAQ
jgi:hypothetical protein